MERFEFYDVEIVEMGGAAAGGGMWATLRVQLRDRETDLLPSIRVSVPLTRSRAASLGELEEAARAYAIEALRTAAALLGESSVQDLQAKREAREAAERADWSQGHS